MKFLLSIILWAIVPMLTPQGLQIGVVNINNNTIRIMKMNLNNPAFLQSASNVGGGEPITRFVFVEGQNQLQLSANGSVTIESVQGGEKVSEKYNDLSETAVTINADTDTEVVIYGAVTKFAIYPPYPHNVLKSLDVSKNTALNHLGCDGCTSLTSLDLSKNTSLTALFCGGCTSLTSLDLSNNTSLTAFGCGGCTSLTSLDLIKNTTLTTLNCSNCTSLTSLDLSNNTALTSLYCDGCTSLTSLDLSKNTALTYLNCYGCTGLMLLDIQNTAIVNGGNIFTNISTNLTTLQVAGTSAWAYEQVENWLNGDAPSDGTILVDENTPEGVITAATGKSWTVEYADAA